MVAQNLNAPREEVHSTDINFLLWTCIPSRNQHGLWFKVFSLLAVFVCFLNAIIIVSFHWNLQDFDIDCTSKHIPCWVCLCSPLNYIGCRMIENQRLNWVDNGPCCEPQFWQPHILVIGVRVGNSKGIPLDITMSTPTLTLEGNTLQNPG